MMIKARLEGRTQLLRRDDIRIAERADNSKVVDITLKDGVIFPLVFEAKYQARLFMEDLEG